MRLGLHVGIGHGYDDALAYGKRIGCTALQMFSSTSRTYRTQPPDQATLDRFRVGREEAGIDPVAFHTSYLINLASDDPKIAAGSLKLLKNDLTVAGKGGISLVNTHLGSYGKRPRSEGFSSVVAALETALEGIAPGVLLVMENSAGAGALCGGTIEELGELLRAVDHPQLGICIDTAHSWAAGYEINTQGGVDRFVDLIATECTLERLHMFHFNDTQVPLGGHRDRHYHIGEGLIGFEGFRALARRPELRDKTAILETPGEEADDVRNLQTIRAIFAGAVPAV